MIIFYFLFIFATFSIRLIESTEKYFCFQSTKVKNQTQIKSLPKKYGVSIEFVDQVKNFSADIEDNLNGDISSLKCDHGDVHYWIFNRTSNFFTFVKTVSESETACQTKLWSPEASKETSTDSPLFFPYDLIKLDKPVASLYELFELFKSSTNVTEDKINHEHDHGIDVDHYLACNRTSDDKYWLEFSVCVTKNEFNLPDKNAANVPTRIEMKIYSGTATNVQLAFSAVYEMSRYRMQLDRDEEETFLPPSGVKCEGWPKTKPFPENMPQKFSVHVDYVDYDKSTIDTSKIYFDSERKIVGFDYSHNNTDEPMTSGLNLAPGQYKVVHDFKSGLQYVLNPVTMSCVGVSPIPYDAGDVKPVERKLDMKSVQEILISPDVKDYVYVGKRFVDDVPMDVWSGSFTRNRTDPEKRILNESLVFDVYFSTAPWTVDSQSESSSSSLPMFLKVYHRDNYKRYTSTAQHFHDYHVYTGKTNLLWTQLNVFPCLNMSLNDSFFVVQMNGTFNDLQISGLDHIENRMKEVLADAANVSVLRVTNFFYQTESSVGQKSIYVFFFISDKSNQTPTPTLWSEPEVDASTARKNLNESLLKKNLEFSVTLPNGTILYFAVQKGTLNVTAPYFKPRDVPKFKIVDGFSRGSMAALGICMLLIGVITGMAAAFYMWKRNRGIAYQIYE